MIPLTSKGMTIPYVLEIETEEGSIEIALQTHLAPNHVRNFVARGEDRLLRRLAF